MPLLGPRSAYVDSGRTLCDLPHHPLRNGVTALGERPPLTERVASRAVNRGFAMKRWRALNLGILLGRSSTFKLPPSIRVDGRQMNLSLPDEKGVGVAFMEILLSDVYGLERLRNPTHLLDIGAHVGLFTLAARLRHPKAVIHSYEPNKQLARRLEQNTAWTGALIHYEAIGRTKGRGFLEHGDDSVLTRTVRGDEGDVAIVSLSEAVERLGGHVSMAKVDCEGCEWELLEDPAPWQQIDSVSLEYHGDSQKAADRLCELGYAIEYAQTGPYGLIRANRE